METKSYEQIMSICFKLTGKNFDGRDKSCVARINEFLRKFRRLVEATKVEKGDLKAWPVTVDEQVFELLDTSTLLGSFQIKWNIVDGENWASNLNERVRPLIHNALRKMHLWNEQKYGDRLEIFVLDTAFQGSPRTGRWPKSEPMVISF